MSKKKKKIVNNTDNTKNETDSVSPEINEANNEINNELNTASGIDTKSDIEFDSHIEAEGEDKFSNEIDPDFKMDSAPNVFQSITSIINAEDDEAFEEVDEIESGFDDTGSTDEAQRVPESKADRKIPDFLKPYMYYIRIAGVLIIVCAFVALMLSVVNSMTVNIIAENEAKEREASVLEIFTDADSVVLYKKVETGSGRNQSKVNIKEIYEIKKGSDTVGYCVSLSSIGFKGEIDMMVGTDMNNELTGVKIISMSETPGLGTKAGDEEFLSQFNGVSGNLAVGSEIDAVSGATISSKAVTAGVNAVLALNIPENPELESLSPIDPATSDTDSIDVSVPPIDTPDTDPVTDPQVESEPPETLPPETQPVPVPEETTAPPETQPPVETEPPETQPPETAPPAVIVQPPPETTPPETQPPDTQPPETTPPETQPPETAPPETQPPETQPPETTPPETEPPAPPAETEPETEETEEVIEHEWRPW